ncbi:MAG: hypothetical protein Q9208_001457 [Pyrenodesmia sp. 3 TL-2023]
MIPEIYPWRIYSTFKVGATTYEFFNEQTGEAFFLTFTALLQTLGDVTRESVLFAFAPINLPLHPQALDYYEVFNMPYYDSADFLRWIFSEHGLIMPDLLAAFDGAYDPHMPLHVRLGMHPFAARDAGGPSGAPLPAAVPALPAALPAAVPDATPASPAEPASPLQAAPSNDNIRTIAYEDLDLPKVNIKAKGRNPNLTADRRVVVPFRLWEGFKQWKEEVMERKVTATAQHREVNQAHLDGYLRYYLEEQNVRVPANAQPVEGYHVTRNFEYVQEAPM